jgi:hypothetical protein
MNVGRSYGKLLFSPDQLASINSFIDPIKVARYEQQTRRPHRNCDSTVVAPDKIVAPGI